MIKIKNIMSVVAMLFVTTFASAQHAIYSIGVLRGDNTGGGQLFDKNTQTGWFPGWNAGDYPTRMIIDFGVEVNINKIKFYDWVGQPNLIIEDIDIANNIVRSTQKIKLNNFDKWVNASINTITTRHIVIGYDVIEGDIPLTEIEFYYNESGTNNPLPNNISGDALKIGTNGFHWVPSNQIPVPNIRCYQMSGWTWTPSGLMVEPSYQANANYDSYYQELKDKGITPITCINKVPEWWGNVSDPEWADVRFHKEGDNPQAPESYRDVAEYAWQLAARYGSVRYPSEFLKVNQTPRWNGDPVNIVKSGLGLLKYIEIENEPDRPWKQPKYKYTPEQFAALCSAVYDGHEGRLGQGYGIKQADSTIQVVMAGLAGIDLNYINKMNQWFKANRTDQRFACDVINFHHYCNTANQFPSSDVILWNGSGTSPEADNLDYRLKNAVQYVDMNVSKYIKVWFSEFGYDTNPCSTVLCQYPESHQRLNAYQLQAEWNLRTFLISISSGIEKTFVYNLIDEPSADMGYIFGSSGLINNQYEPKLSYYRLQWLVNELNGFTFDQEMVSNVKSTHIMKFVNRKTDEEKYFYWSSEEGLEVNGRIGGKKIRIDETVKVIKLKSKKLFAKNKLYLK